MHNTRGANTKDMEVIAENVTDGMFSTPSLYVLHLYFPIYAFLYLVYTKNLKVQRLAFL